MDRKTSAAHAAHDESLIARLYGNDVAADERARALELVAECRDCADLLSDLGAVANAAASMPIPRRPRDFSLTEADVARLRRRRMASWLFGAGLRRSLGGSLAALGLVGVLATGLASITSGSASSPEFTSNQSLTGGAQPVAAPSQADMAAFGSAAAPTAAPAATAAASERAATNLSPTAAGVSPAATSYTVSSGSTAPAPQGDVNKGAQASQPGGGFGPLTPAVPSGPAQGGLDARTVWLGGFAALFVLGLAIALWPRRRRDRAGEDVSQ